MAPNYPEGVTDYFAGDDRTHTERMTAGDLSTADDLRIVATNRQEIECAADDGTPGVIAGDNSVVGTGSVVTTNGPADGVVAGNPARVITHLDASA